MVTIIHFILLIIQKIDGGQLDNPDISIYDAMNEILEDLDIEIPGHKDEIDYEELEEKS